VSVDYYTGLSPAQTDAVKAFNRQIEEFGRNLNPPSPGSYMVSSLEGIAFVLSTYFTPIGDKLMMGSKDFLVDKLTRIRQVSHALLLLGDESGRPDAHGYLASPCSMLILRNKHPLGSALVLDNRLPESRETSTARERRTSFPDEKGGAYELADLITARTPLVIFSCGSAYTNPHRLQGLITDFYRGPTIC